MSIKLYWCRGKGRSDSSQQNFGDYLSPLIVEMLSSTKVEYAPVHQAQMMAIGSILPREKKAKGIIFPRKLHIWGAGTDSPGLKFSSRHYYHAVRGRESESQIDGMKRDLAVGDPGLLAEHWWSGRGRPEKRFKVGLIPHYVDKNNVLVREAAQQPGVRMIDVFAPVEQVLRDIQSCECILSSSMHGLIVADAFGIPNRRVRVSSGLISDFKFVDYYSVFSMAEPVPLAPEQLLQLARIDPVELVGDYARPNIDLVKQRLISAFPKL